LCQYEEWIFEKEWKPDFSAWILRFQFRYWRILFVSTEFFFLRFLRLNILFHFHSSIRLSKLQQNNAFFLLWINNYWVIFFCLFLNQVSFKCMKSSAREFFFRKNGFFILISSHINFIQIFENTLIFNFIVWLPEFLIVTRDFWNACLKKRETLKQNCFSNRRNRGVNLGTVRITQKYHIRNFTSFTQELEV
jgi:hypothetical protein